MKYGETADYLTARIARDRPDILVRMKAGEFPSVRKAALDRPGEVTTFTANRIAWSIEDGSIPPDQFLTRASHPRV